MQIRNDHDVPLLLAAWLMSDEYDYVADPKYISATGLMRPVQELVLAPRVPPEEQDQGDLTDRIARALGNSVHDAVERVWTKPELLAKSLSELGLTPEDISKVEVNPKKPDPEKTQVYVEQRERKKIAGYTIGGKYDAIIEGVLHDIKTTSAWAWAMGTRDADFQLQGSIYRWLNPDKVTEDIIRVCFVFTDWQRSMANSNPKYPDSRCKYKDIPLLSIEETEKWIRKRINQIEKFKDAPASAMPPCSDEDVWMTEPKYRYFRDITKTDGRATRVFDSHDAAIQHFNKTGQGIIITTDQVAKRCKDYCSAFTVCEQKDTFILE